MSAIPAPYGFRMLALAATPGIDQIDDFEAATMAGYTLYLPDIEYVLSRTWVIDVRNFTVIGNGQGVLPIDFAATHGTSLRWIGAPGGPVVQVDGSEVCRISDLAIDGDGIADVGLEIHNHKRVDVERVTVVDCTEKELRVWGLSVACRFRSMYLRCPGAAANVTAQADAGQAVVLVDQNGYWSVGNTIRISHVDAATGVATYEDKVIASKTGTTSITLTTNLANTYPHPAQAVDRSWVTDPTATAVGLSVEDDPAGSTAHPYNLGFDMIDARAANGTCLRFECMDDVWLGKIAPLVQGHGKTVVFAGGATNSPSASQVFGMLGQYGGGIVAEAGSAAQPPRSITLFGVGTEDIGTPRIHVQPGAQLYYQTDEGRNTFATDMRTAIPPLEDDFITGGLTDGTIGRLGWGLIGGTITRIPSEDGHPGILRVSTTTAGATLAGIVLPKDATNGVILPAWGWDMMFVLRFNDTDTDTGCRAGLGMPYSAVPTTDFVGIEKPGGQTTTVGVRRVGGVQGAQIGPFSDVTAGAWFRVRIRRKNDTTVGISIGDAPNFGVEQLFTSGGVPTIPLNPLITIRNGVGVAKTMDIDAFQLRVIGLGPR